MGTPEDAEMMRGGNPICGAQRSGRSSSGPGTCRNFAGFGTDHVGFGRCKFHGGSTRNHRTKAATDQAVAKMATYGEPIVVDPAVALLMEVHRTAGHVEWLNHQIRDVDDVNSADGRSLANLYMREREHLVRVTKAALDSGIAEREVRLVERQGNLMATAILAVLHELSLTRAQYSRAKQLVSAQLRGLGSGPPGSVEQFG